MATYGKPLGSFMVNLELKDTQFKQTMASVQNQTKYWAQEMRTTMRVADQYGTQTDKLKAKMTGLTNVIEVQQKEVEHLKQQYLDKKKAEGESAEATMNHARKLRKAEQNLNSYQIQLNEVSKELKLANSRGFQLGETLESIGGKMTKLGSSLTKAFTVPLTLGIGAAIKATADFEDAFSGIRKTVDGTEKDFKMLEKGIREMAQEIPVSAVELANLGESAGQLGIETENILGFVRTMADLGVATNLVGQEGAASLAKFASVMDMSQANFDRLGSSIVDLGNNFATTEKDILDMSLRLAGVGNQLNMSEADVLGISAALSQVGVEAEAGGSAMTQALKKMNNAVAGGTEELDSFAKTAGMTREEFSKLFKEDAAKALQAYVEGLEKASKNGENLNDVLGEVGIKGIREADALLRLAGNSKILGEALGISGEAWEDNTALTEEAQEKYKTFYSQLDIFKNMITEIGIELGGPFMAALTSVMEASKPLLEILKNMAQTFADMPKQTQENIVKFAGLAIAAGPLLKIFGGLTGGIGGVIKKMSEFSVETSFVTGESSKLAKVVGKAKTGLPEFGTNVMKFLVAPFKSFGRAVLHPVKSTKLLFSTLSGGLLNVKTLFSSGFLVLKGFFSGISSGIMTLLTQGISFSGVFNGIVGIFGALVNPVTITIGLFAALAGGILYLNKQTGSFSETFKLLKESITNFFKTVYNDYIAPALEEVTEAFKKSFETIKEFWNEYGQQFLDALTNFFSFVWAMIQPALGFWTGIFKSTFSTIVSLVKVSWDLVKGLFSGAFKVIGGLIKIFTGVFTGDWETMWNGVKDVAKGSWNIIATGFEAFVNAFLSVAEGLSNGITKGIVGAVNGVIKAVSWILDKFGLDKLKEWEVGEIKIKRVTLPKFAKGSGGLLMDTLGVVNDQKGSNYREMIIPPKGEPFIPRGRDVVLPMEKGTQIVPASITKEFTDSLPHFKKGTGGLFRNVWEGTKNTVGKLWGKVKDFTGNIMDYFDKPKELVQYAVNKFTNIPELPSFWLDMAHGAVKHTSSKAVGFVKSKFEDFMSSSNFIGDDSIGSNGVYSYLMDIARSLMRKYNMVFTSGFRPGDPYDHGKGLAVDIALPGVVNGSPIYQAAAEDAIRMPGVKYVITNGKWKHKGKSWVPWPDGDHYDHVHISGEKPVKSSYGGTGVDRWRETVVRALQITGQYSPANVNRTLYQMKTESGGNPRAINNWDINAKNGTPSKGLMQVIDPTFRAYAKAPFNKDIYDPLSNIIASIRYATSRYGSLAAAYRGTGYENGGLVNRHQIAQIAEGNKPEMIIPLTKKTRAVELINKAKSIIGMENGSVVVNNDTERLEALVAKQADMVESMSEKMIALLEVIAQKELTIDDESFNRNVNSGQGMLLKKNLVRG